MKKSLPLLLITFSPLLHAIQFYDSSFAEDYHLQLTKKSGKAYDAVEITDSNFNLVENKKWSWITGECDEHYWSLDFDLNKTTYTEGNNIDKLNFVFEDGVYIEKAENSEGSFKLYYIDELNYLISIFMGGYDNEGDVKKYDYQYYHSWNQECE